MRVLKIVLLLALGALVTPLITWTGWIIEGWMESRERYESFNKRLNDFFDNIHRNADQLWRGHL